MRLVEAIDGDFAELVGRLLVFATWRLSLFERLSTHDDPVLAAIVAKGLKELAYHRDYAAQWVVRLGDGTDLSKTKMQSALEVIWPLVDELFDSDAERAEFDIVIDTVLATATLERPEAAPLGGVSGHSGREGVHTEAFGYVLAELQSVARAHPDATW
jgi:ring-1,2-phenylacetyl-CoA epoxidase subunit PaaC